MTREYKTETHTDEKGFVRFDSNDAIPFSDYLQANHPELNDAQIEAHDAKRQDENVAKMQQWMQDEVTFRDENPELAAEQDAERAFELRANFEPGTKVVNVITGETIRV